MGIVGIFPYHHFDSSTMKVAAVLLAVCMAAHASQEVELDKRFILSDIKDAFNNIGSTFTHLWHNAKEGFDKPTHGNLSFNDVVNRLIPEIHGGMTTAACVKVCVSGLGAAFPPSLWLEVSPASPPAVLPLRSF